MIVNKFQWFSENASIVIVNLKRYSTKGYVQQNAQLRFYIIKSSTDYHFLEFYPTIFEKLLQLHKL